jgi:hypothetical protein
MTARHAARSPTAPKRMLCRHRSSSREGSCQAPPFPSFSVDTFPLRRVAGPPGPARRPRFSVIQPEVQQREG